MCAFALHFVFSYIIFIHIYIYSCFITKSVVLCLFFVLTGEITVICCYNQQASVEQHPTLILKQTHWSCYLYIHIPTHMRITTTTTMMMRVRMLHNLKGGGHPVFELTEHIFTNTLPRSTYALVYLTKCAKIFLIVEKLHALYTSATHNRIILTKNAEKRRCRTIIPRFENANIIYRGSLTHRYFQHYKMQIIWGYAQGWVGFLVNDDRNYGIYVNHIHVQVLSQSRVAFKSRYGWSTHAWVIHIIRIWCVYRNCVHCDEHCDLYLLIKKTDVRRSQTWWCWSFERLTFEWYFFFPDVFCYIVKVSEKRYRDRDR